MKQIFDIRYIGYFLLINGFFQMFSSCIWALIGNDDKWFSRLFLSLVCFGFSALILKEDN